MDILSHHPSTLTTNHSTENDWSTTNDDETIDKNANYKDITMNDEMTVRKTEESEFLLLPEAIARWVEKVRKGSDDTFNAIIAHAKTVFDAETDLENTYSTDVRDQFRRESGLSQSMLSKLKQVGKKAAMFSVHKDRLPPSLTILYELSKLDIPKLEKTIEKGLKDKTRSQIQSLVSSPDSNPPTVRQLISFSVDAGIDDKKLIPIIKEIRSAVDNSAMSVLPQKADNIWFEREVC